MRHRLLIAVLLLFSLSTACSSAQKSGQSNSGLDGGKTQHISGYYRKDGTYVAPYDRRAPSSPSRPAHNTLASTPSSATAAKEEHTPEAAQSVSSVQRDEHGRIKRSAAAKDAFKRVHPCPATGRSTGSCPGYVIDHINPLECGGADAPSNMQWQTVADGKVKDRTERYCQ
jgi:hypothetical protein